MDRLNGQITEIVTNLWDTMFSMPIKTAKLGADESKLSLTGAIAISGDWSCIIHLYCSQQTVSKVSAQIFSIDINEVSRQDIADTMSEITNMTGGNLKTTLPGPSKLSLPQIVFEFHPIKHNPEIEEIRTINLVVNEDEPLRVDIAILK
ncbi:chemotaxis protein CheX [Legionella dresdenensis]|uniref:Chemotaxis protein CheX n=1 Tax=Legionella dresdenensis TaxID=450200 RepID=A0ABV8CH67_9GAMM